VKAGWFVAVLVLAVLLASAVACGGGGGESGPADEVADAAVAAYADLDTYQFDMDMTVEMHVTAADGTVESTLMVSMSGASDRANERKYTSMQISTDPTSNMEGCVELYYIGDQVYMKTSNPGEPPTWLKWGVCLSCGAGEKLDVVGRQMDLLKDPADVEIIDNDTVDATECYVLEVKPDPEKLWEWVKDQIALENQLPTLSVDIEDVITDFAIDQWIAKDTHLLIKSTLDMTLTFSSYISCPSCGLIPVLPGESSRTYGITATLMLYDVNQPVSIELPPEAEDAEEIDFAVPVL